jgi:hypothetical protein
VKANSVHSALRPPMTYCASPGWLSWWSNGGMIIGKGNRNTRRKPVPMPLCPPQIPHAVRTRTRVAAVGSQRLTAWAMARPITDLSTKTITMKCRLLRGNFAYVSKESGAAIFSEEKMSVISFLRISWLPYLQPWECRHHVPLKRLWITTILNSVTSQKM